MRELSLHMLDLIENSIRANASVISVEVREDAKDNLLEILIEDNGSGLSVDAERALDPYYTTKSGKRTGLGLSLFKATAEQAGGTLTLGASSLGGLAVRVAMGLRHNRPAPIGRLGDDLIFGDLHEPGVGSVVSDLFGHHRLVGTCICCFRPTRCERSPRSRNRAAVFPGNAKGTSSLE